METYEKTWDAEGPLREEIVKVLRRWADACDEVFAHDKVIEKEQVDKTLEMMYDTVDQADTLHVGIDEEFSDGKGLTKATRDRREELFTKVEDIEAELEPLEENFQKMFGDLVPAEDED